MHLVLFSTLPLVFDSACSLLSVLLHLMHQHLQSSQSHSWKWPPAVSGSAPGFLQRTLKRKFQMFGISASSWRRHLNTVERWGASAGYPPTPVPLGPSSYFSATLLFTQHLANIMTTSYRVSAIWRDWWKGMWGKTPSGWGHMTNGTEELQQREETLTPLFPLKGNSSSFWSSHIQQHVITNTAHRKIQYGNGINAWCLFVVLDIAGHNAQNVINTFQNWTT